MTKQEPPGAAHLREQLRSSQPVFDGGFLHVLRDTVALPDGKSVSREYIRHPGAVVIVPLLDGDRVLLERQYRHPVGQVMTEFPAGKLDAGEDPLLCARRELREETGYAAAQWVQVAGIHPAIGYSTEYIHVWLARDLRAGTQRLDEGEFVETFAASIADFLRWCCEGVITDGKTLACAFWLQAMAAGHLHPQWQTLALDREK